MTADSALPDRHPITVHVDDTDGLLSRATRSTSRTDLVLTPEQLHGRNLKQRLAARSQPRSSLRFSDLATVARDLVGAADGSPSTLDRIDRIRALEAIVDDRPDAFEPFEALYGSQLASHAPAIEATRATVDAVTGFREGRLETLRRLVDDLPKVARLDARDRLDGAVAVEQRLAKTAESAVSGDAVLRAATAYLREDAGLFTEVYPDTERLHLAGVSSVDASLRDFLTTVAEETPVDVRLWLRTGTGPGLASRLCGDESVTWDGGDLPTLALDVPVTELVATTRAAEARAALAVVTRLLDAGVSPSDVLVVARDVGVYERALGRAGRHYGQPLSFWTQLAVGRTRPYALVESVCALLDARGSEIPAETLLGPLFAEWVPPGTDTDWDPPLAELDDGYGALTTIDSQSLDEWRVTVESEPLPESVEAWFRSLLAWAEQQPTDPGPADVGRALGPLPDRYREVVLPAQRARDDGTLATTTESARALVRLERLVEEVERKYEEWLARDQTDRTWEAVGVLFETIATVRPGRREHANAAVVDVVEATDTWARTAPYVVAVGLVDGEWPLAPEGLLPVELRDAVLRGERASVRELSPREGWTTAREFDHFADAVSTATTQLVCTRFEQGADGTAMRRSPFLDALEPTPTVASTDATRKLLSAERELPAPLSATLSERAER